MLDCTNNDNMSVKEHIRSILLRERDTRYYCSNRDMAVNDYERLSKTQS